MLFRSKYDLQAEYKLWESWYAHISEKLTQVPGVSTKVSPPGADSPYPVLVVSWDRERIGMTAGELGRMLLEGEPRIMSHAEGDGYSCRIRPVAMKPGEYKLVAQRLLEIFRSQGPKAAPALRPPAADVAGRWEVDLEFVIGATRHKLFLETNANRVTRSEERRVGKECRL